MKTKFYSPSLNKRLRSVAFLAAALLSFATAQAQNPSRDSLLIKSFENDALLPLLIDSALKYSPDIRRIDNNIGMLEENNKVNKKLIFNTVSLVSSYGYGTSGDITVGNAGNGSASSSYFKSSQQDRYNVGFNVLLPLSQILSRKNTIRSGNYQVKMAESERDNTALYVKQQVIKLYQDLKLSQKLLNTSSEHKQSAKATFEMGEKSFLQGQINLDQLASIQDIYNKATMEFDTHINSFQTNYMQLEAYTGTSIYSLISKLK